MLIPAITVGDTINGKENTQRKNDYNKVFTVNSDATLKINNSYGNLDIVTWNENRIEIQVSITTNGNDEEKVQKKLDEITVDFDICSRFGFSQNNFQQKQIEIMVELDQKQQC